MQKEEASKRFESLLEAHAGIVFRVVRTYAQNPEDQLDLIQEIKLQLWRAYPQFDPAAKFSTWMYRICLNTAISWLRWDSRRRTTSLDDTQEPAVGLGLSTEQIALRAMIDGLTPFNRALLLLYLDELPQTEIGAILGISSANVATRISRLKTELALQNERTPE
jgi:RNA polymerase sigma-70 factor (ECF subfamily)